MYNKANRYYDHWEVKNPNSNNAIRKYCNDHNLYFEPSDAGYGWTHFAILCNKKESEEITRVMEEAEIGNLISDN